MTGRGPLTVRGEVRVPGDKSISHRALMLAALASGRSHVRGLLRSADVESTAAVLRRLGCAIPALGEEVIIDGRSLAPLPPPASPLDCGNSGTTTRLVMGIAAASPIAATFTGDASLSRRPMGRVARPLEWMGARVDFAGPGQGLPLTVRGGQLRGIEWKPESASAQVKSAILLAGLCAGVSVAVQEPQPTRDHTERMLRAQGAEVARDGEWVRLAPTSRLEPAPIRVPGDPSSAAFFVALGAVADAGTLVVRGVGLNPGRVGFLDVLRRMGADVEVREARETGAEPIGDLVVRPSPLRGTSIEAPEIPSLIDELPVLACVAARAEGETVIRGAGELRVKESDRIAAVVSNLRAIGVEAEELPDGMRIHGRQGALAGVVTSHDDHRIAMAFGILGCSRGAAIQVDGAGSVAVSYPDFWRDLARVAV